MKRVQIRIDKEGNYSVDAKEGFTGIECAKKTEQLQLILGGTQIAEKKKPEYYDPSGNNPVSVDLS